MANIKQQIVGVGSKWITEQVDIAVEHNPRLAYISKRLKDGLCNTLANKIDKIDPYLPYFTDENGEFNIKSISEELLNAFSEMPIRDYEVMGLNMQVGKGQVVVMFPDNIFTNLLLDNNKLLIERADIQELINMIGK